MSFIPNLLDIGKVTVKTAFLILLISSCLLFLPQSILLKLEIAGFKHEFGKYFGAAFIASAAFLIIAVLNWFQEKINYFFRKRKNAIQIIKAIGEMDYKEALVLREFYINAQQSLDMPIDDPVVAGMLNKGLLYKISSMGQMSRDGMMFPVAINKLLKDSLKPERLGLVLNPSEEKSAEILDARPDWAKSITRRKSNNWY